MVRVVNLFSVVRPAVQNTYKRLQIQEVHFRLHSNVQLSRLLLPLFSAGSLPVMFYFNDFKQNPGGRTTVLLSIRLYLIKQRRP